MAVELYYFSGAGNSLHVARELQQRLFGARHLPIAALLAAGVLDAAERPRAAPASTAGFVFPIHGLTAPAGNRDSASAPRRRTAE